MKDPAAAPDGSDLNSLASVRMERGIALLNAGSPEAWHEAIRCFEEVITLRQQLPLADNPEFRYGLSAGWINRGDALARLGGGENLADAVNSYTTAIELLKEVPAGDDDGLFVRRLAIAWMNRGVALEAQESAPALSEAIRSYEAAVALLNRSPHTGDVRHKLVLASAWTNLGNAQLHSAGSELAATTCAAAETALSLLAETEAHDLAAAETGLKARHVLCQAIAAVLAAPAHDTTQEMDLIGKMTDAVEDALGLVQSWERAGVARFRPLATHLFHLGALVYEKHQPQFLAEFLLEHLDPKRAGGLPPEAANWLAIADASLARASRGIAGRDFEWLATPQGRRGLETLKELQAAQVRLRAVRGAGPA